METADEREARGHPVGQATPYAAMGGLTGFSSLAEGYMRLDPSGMGKNFIIYLSILLCNYSNTNIKTVQYGFYGVISLKYTFNKKYYFHKNKRYAINTEFHIHYFLFLFIAQVYFAQEYHRSSGICILA